MRTFIIIQKTTVIEVWDVQSSPEKGTELTKVGYGMIVPDDENWRRLVAKG